MICLCEIKLSLQLNKFYYPAPPSYEQCVFGTTQIEDENDRHPIGSVPFAPMYPVYHFDNTNQTMLGQQTQTQTMSGIITA